METEFKRFRYTLGKKSRLKLIGQLEKYNNDLEKLLGNSDKLEPIRKKRRSAMPKLFQQIRDQASSLHSAMTRAWLCNHGTHVTKFILGRPGIQDSAYTKDQLQDVKFNFYFPLSSRLWSSSSTLVEQDDSWCATKVEMAEVKSFADASSENSRDDLRSISFVSNVGRRVSTASVPSDAVEINDLCVALKQHTQD